MSSKLEILSGAELGRIRLNRPEKLNALDLEMLLALESALEQFERDKATRVIVIESAGKKAFCVGADINAFSALSPLEMWSEWVRCGHRVFQRLSTARQPVIAAIQGFAFGGGLELALACDIRIAADTARFAMPEVKLGTVPGWAGTSRLPDLIGKARANQMIFTGEPIDADQAVGWGLVNEVVPVEKLLNRVNGLADQIAANAPIAVQTAKQLISGPVSPTLESLASAATAFTSDAREGIAAFGEKRQAKFRGE
jgi:enoyl-CoA hydratase/carnithine racemase